MKRLLIVNAKEYFPLDAGDKIISFGLLKQLHPLAELHVINILDNTEYNIEQINLIKANAYSLHLLNDPLFPNIIALGKSYLEAIPFFKSRRSKWKKVSRRVNQLIQQVKPEIIIWDHMRSTAYFQENSFTNILVEHNDEEEIYRQKVKLYPLLIRPFLKLQTEFLRRHNRKLHYSVDQIVYLSEKDIHAPYIEKKVFLRHMMANFPPKPYISKENNDLTILFAGALDWYANIDGVEWFLKEVMVKLKAGFRLLVVGKNPSEKMIKLIAQYRNVEIHKNVPSMQPFYEIADVVVSPIKIGSGINIKILEAISYSLPLVCTTFSKKGYEGLNFIPSAENSSAFVNELTRLRNLTERIKLSEQVKKWYAEYIAARAKNIEAVFLVNK